MHLVLCAFVFNCISSTLASNLRSDKKSNRGASSSSSSNRSLIVDEILSRPAITPPEKYLQDTDSRAYDGRSLALSLKDVQAIYQDYIRGVDNSKQKAKYDLSGLDQQDNQDYDFAEELYGTDPDEDVDDDDDDDDDEEEEEEDLTDGLNSEFSYLSSSKSSRLETEQDKLNKRLFENAWRCRGLECKGMEPQDLAKAVTQIKVDLLEYDIGSSLGILASNHVRRNNSMEYWSQYRFWARRITSIMKHKEEAIRDEECLKGIDLTLDQKKKILNKKIATVQFRTYERETERQRKFDSRRDGTIAMMKAEKAGKVVLTVMRHAMEMPDLQWDDVDIAQIEYYTRGLDVDYDTPKEDRISKESIKRFLKKYLNKEQREVDEFSRRRLDWKVKYFQKRQQDAYDPYRQRRKHTKSVRTL